MANKIDIDTLNIEDYPSKSNVESKEATRDIRVYFLIVCEGEKTEPNYFKSFPKHAGNVIYNLEFGEGGKNTKSVVKEAETIIKKSSTKFDRVWVVFDKDDFKDVQFNAAISMAEDRGYGCAWTNEAFELWYLLHFQYRDSAMDRSEYARVIEQEINKIIKKDKKSKKGKVKDSDLFKYKKNSKEMFKILQKFGNQNKAIERSKKLENMHLDKKFAQHNPCTKVYKLVEELIGASETLKDAINIRYLSGE